MSEQDVSLKLFVVLSRAYESIMARVKEDIRGYDLNLTEFSVLELLYNKGDQPIQKIGEKVLLASSSMTYVVDRLEEKKLLNRRPCVNDRRVTYTSITDEGKALMDEIFPKHAQAVHRIMDGLDQEQKTQLIQLLKKLGLHHE